MENIDPVGVHTGDSIVVAPTQTLANREYQMLRSAALNIISALEIEGGCNVQFALNPDSFEYAVIEVNPRVSRSSALASKATGYPIAKVAAKVALGYTLDEIPNAVTGKTTACFEPTLDYCVLKIPRLPFDKFTTASRTLGTQMKATGEVMAIGNSFEGALMKAIRSLELTVQALQLPKLDEPVHRRDRGPAWSQIDRRASLCGGRGPAPGLLPGEDQRDHQDRPLVPGQLPEHRGHGGRAWTTAVWTSRTPCSRPRRWASPTAWIAALSGGMPKADEGPAGELRHHPGLQDGGHLRRRVRQPRPPTTTPPMTEENEAGGHRLRQEEGAGAGLRPHPHRPGHRVRLLLRPLASGPSRRMGYETIIINNNPETVSTDFDVADKLYFEPLTAEDVQNIVELEKPWGAVVQFGGQTAIKLAQALTDMGVHILGTSADGVDAAEDRERFDEILEKCAIPRAAGPAPSLPPRRPLQAANELGYPVLVRPSYVLGGQGMEIAYTDRNIERVHAHHQPDRSGASHSGRQVPYGPGAGGGRRVRRGGHPHPRHHGACGAGRRPLRRLHLGLSPPPHRGQASGD